MDDKHIPGAYIERGEVVDVDESGYTVRSYDRIGVTAYNMSAYGNGMFSKGDTVYFFMFPDGNGLIISKTAVMEGR